MAGNEWRLTVGPGYIHLVTQRARAPGWCHPFEYIILCYCLMISIVPNHPAPTYLVYIRALKLSKGPRSNTRMFRSFNMFQSDILILCNKWVKRQSFEHESDIE